MATTLPIARDEYMVVVRGAQKEGHFGHLQKPKPKPLLKKIVPKNDTFLDFSMKK